MLEQKYSPAMQQYVDIKQEHQDKIIFFRLGDFYEFFFEDARTCAKLLDLVLTKKKAGNGNLVDMAGVPHHSYQEYVKKLVENGYKVAIVEQMENPSEVKGIVKRSVVEVVTPATIAVEQNQFQSSYLAVITKDVLSYEVCYFDVITKQVLKSNLDDITSLCLELNTLNIKEILVNFKQKEIDKYCVDNLITKSVFKNNKIRGTFEIGKAYLKEILNLDVDLFNHVVSYQNDEHILLSKSTLDNLEVFNNDIKNNLFNTINNTQTMMGARKLSSLLRRPLKKQKLIAQNLAQVQHFYDNTLQRMEIINHLKSIGDLDRLNTRLMLNKLTPRGVLKLKDSIKQCLKVAYTLNIADFDLLNDFIKLVESSILSSENLTQSRYVNPEFDVSLAQIFAQAKSSQEWLINYEQHLKETYDLKSLKIGFNKIFGYYIEVSKAQSKLVPEFFIRKQTLVNNERYISEEMKEKESLILNSEANYINKQNEIFTTILNQLKDFNKLITKLSNYIAKIDVSCSNAQLAKEKKLVCPEFAQETKVVGSRHLTIEAIIGEENFVSNDYEFSQEHIIILTGPNMSGKSTYMRQIALTQLMAQCGLFVPCSSAKLEIVDQIFTRIGAGDDLSSGKSTFLVEMEETSYALKNATDDSLIILDELGRGTSTYDGLSIAFGVVKYINDHLKAKTVLATHYHELTTLKNILTNTKNMTIEVIEKDNKVIFKHKIINGRAHKSYGIHVAAIANVAPEVLASAQVFLKKLEQTNQISLSANELEFTSQTKDDSPITKALENLDINNLTPLEAMNVLASLKKMVNNG